MCREITEHAKQTFEHILYKLLSNKFPDTSMVVYCKCGQQIKIDLTDVTPKPVKT